MRIILRTHVSELYKQVLKIQQEFKGKQSILKEEESQSQRRDFRCMGRDCVKKTTRITLRIWEASTLAWEALQILGIELLCST